MSYNSQGWYEVRSDGGRTYYCLPKDNFCTCGSVGGVCDHLRKIMFEDG